MEFYNKIDSLCKKKGISRRKMCEEINLSYNTFNSMLRRKSTNITLDVIEDIANFLGVTCDYLIKDNLPNNNNDSPPKKSLDEILEEEDKKQRIGRKSLNEILEEEDKKQYAKIAGYGGGVKTIEIGKKEEEEEYYALVKNNEEGYKKIDMTKDEFMKIKDMLDIIRK